MSFCASNRAWHGSRLDVMRECLPEDWKNEEKRFIDSLCPQIHFGYFHQRFDDGLPAEFALAFNAITKADG